MDEIKFIYFDLGGVVVRDFSATNKWEQMISGWGIASEKLVEVRKRYSEFEKEACVGRNVDDFLQILKSEFGVEMPENYSVLNDFVKRFEKNEIIWEIINKCKKRGGIGLLTNAYPGMVSAVEDRNLFPEIEWDVVIDSSMVKCKKPEKEIYEISQSESGVRAEEILFIDNVEKNLVEPNKIGWKTFLYDSRDYEKTNKELEEFLGKYLLY